MFTAEKATREKWRREEKSLYIYMLIMVKYEYYLYVFRSLSSYHLFCLTFVSGLNNENA